MFRCRSLTALLLLGASALGPSNPAEAQGRLGASPGASASMPAGLGSSGIGGVGLGGTSVASPSQYGGLIGGPPGPSVGRIQPYLLRPPGAETAPLRLTPLPEALPGTSVPVVQPVPPGPAREKSDDDKYHPDGINLDEAVWRVIHCNLDLRARFSDISQADADVLTAGLRTNPILYADAQLIPYGSYSSGPTGGPAQFDINIVHPLDLSHKRRSRTRVAVAVRRYVEANYQDAVRLTIDNLYVAYVDALSAQQQYDRSIGLRNDVLNLTTVEEPTQGLWDTQRKLAHLINLPAAEVARRGLRDRLPLPDDPETYPSAPETLEVALACRPDLAAQRLAVGVADANVRAVLASRFDDVLLLYQPFTGRPGGPLGQPNGVAWAIGMTVPLPIYNRQQGALMRARHAAEQARIRLAGAEQTVVSEVQGAYLEHEAAHLAFTRTWDDFVAAKRGTVVLPPDPTLDPLLKERLKTLADQVQALTQDARVDKLNKCYAAIIRHRKSLLRINTVAGRKLLP